MSVNVGTFSEIDCPVCGDHDFKTLLTLTPEVFLNERRKAYYNLSAVGIDEKTEFFFKECRTCRFVLVNPRLKGELYNVIYNEAKIGQYQGKAWAYGEGDLAYLYNTHHKWRCALEFMQAISYFKSHFEKPKNAGYRRLQLLDYGCGYGHTLELCRVFGINGVGVDIDEARLSHCKDKDLVVTKPDDLSADERFHIAIASSVVEHVDDINAFFDYVRRRLVKGGIFHLNGLAPKIIEIERKRGVFKNVMPLEHLNYFTPKSLSRIADKHGFKIVRRRRILRSAERPIQTIYPFIKEAIFKGFYPSGDFSVELQKK